MRMRTSSRGFTLIEALLVVAVVGIGLLISVPPLLRASGATRLRLAAAEVVSALRAAQAAARRHSCHVAVKFRSDEMGRVQFALYRDGDGDGVRSADIASGVDVQLGAPQSLAHFGRLARLGFPSGRAPRDPGDPRRRLDRLEDPVRFNASDLASFGPLGESTPGSVYLTDGQQRLVAVRVFGRTARIRVLVYDPLAETWH